jgi:hypothetical protein
VRRAGYEHAEVWLTGLSGWGSRNGTIGPHRRERGCCLRANGSGATAIRIPCRFGADPMDGERMRSCAALVIRNTIRPGWIRRPVRPIGTCRRPTCRWLTDRQLCELLRDPNQNGHRTVQQIVEHMSTPLVLWAWHPGTGRSPVPMPQNEFLANVRDWAAGGSRMSVV